MGEERGVVGSRLVWGLLSQDQGEVGTRSRAQLVVQ